ncbi:MAG: hypothetical protein JNK15_22460 [Planctomycetes bacterium]|nr:hypothetical protein [Planctomycetota bacterium]
MAKDKGGAPPAPAGKGGGGSGGIGGFGSHLLTIGSVLFVVAWFVPTTLGPQLLTGLEPTLKQLGTTKEAATALANGEPAWLPGWSACRFAWDLLFGTPGAGVDAWKVRMLGGSAVTNGLMLLAVLGALVRARSGLLGLLLVGCAWVNASWIWLGDRSPLTWAGIGYWLWLGSFAFAGLGSMLAKIRRG